METRLIIAYALLALLGIALALLGWRHATREGRGRRREQRMRVRWLGRRSDPLPGEAP